MTCEIIEQPCLVLIGPTAIGKTNLSLTLARNYDCEIISVDSMQVYRYMDIGTAKASLEERSEIVHHLIDIVDPDEDYDAASFAKDALQAIKDIQSRGKMPLLTGGTGLYLQALLEGIFPGVPVDHQIRKNLKERLQKEGASKLHEELMSVDCNSAKRIHRNDTQRLLRALEIYYISGKPWSEQLTVHRNQTQAADFKKLLQLGLTTERAKLYKRIDYRSSIMLESGLEEEVKNLLAKGYHKNLKPFGSIGYRHMINYLEGSWDYEEMARLLARDTRRYAKRQYTWFSRLDDLQWFDVDDRKAILENVDIWLNSETKADREQE